MSSPRDIVVLQGSSRPSSSSSAGSTAFHSSSAASNRSHHAPYGKYRDPDAKGRYIDAKSRTGRNGEVVVVNHFKPNPTSDEPRASDRR